MDHESRHRTQSYILARRQHPAWLLLAARRAPLVLSCLQGLFEYSRDGIVFEEALQALAAQLEQHANSDEFALAGEDCASVAYKRPSRWRRQIGRAHV